MAYMEQVAAPSMLCFRPTPAPRATLASVLATEGRQDAGPGIAGGDSTDRSNLAEPQNPFEPPTRQTKRSPRPLFHFASRESRDDLKNGFAEFLAQYRVASEAWLAGNLNAAGWFPEGCFLPAPPFAGPPPPRRPPSPPTRPITILDAGAVERGEIPVVEVPVLLEARARGQPP